MSSTMDKPRGRGGKRGRPPGAPDSIDANNRALASDVTLLEDRLKSRGCRLPKRNFIIAHIIAKSINRTIAEGRLIKRKVRSASKAEKTEAADQIEIKLPNGMRRMTARYLMDIRNPSLPGLPNDWFQTTYNAVYKILGCRRR